MRPGDYLRLKQDDTRQGLERHRRRLWACFGGAVLGDDSAPTWPRTLAWGAGGLALGLTAGAAFGAVWRAGAVAARSVGRLARVAVTSGLTRVLMG